MLSTEEHATLFNIRTKNKKVPRALEIDQSKWLKPYIKFNTQKELKKKKMMTNLEIILQIIEQYCMWWNNEKLGNRDDVRLVNKNKTKNIWQRFGSI